MQEEIVPYWVQCNECEKWREIPDGTFQIDKESNETFVCSEVKAFRVLIIGKIFFADSFIFS